MFASAIHFKNIQHTEDLPGLTSSDSYSLNLIVICLGLQRDGHIS